MTDLLLSLSQVYHQVNDFNWKIYTGHFYDLYATKFDTNIFQVPLLYLSIEWNSIRLSGPAHGIVTKTVQKFCQGVVGVSGIGGGGGRGWLG